MGISRDSPASHRKFARDHALPFTLLADLDGSAHRALGIGKTLGLVTERVTFVIDGEGVVRYRFSSQLRGKRHAREALETARRLLR